MPITWLLKQIAIAQIPASLICLTNNANYMVTETKLIAEHAHIQHLSHQ